MSDTNIGTKGANQDVPSKSVKLGSSVGSVKHESDGKVGSLQSGSTHGRSGAQTEAIRGNPQNPNS
jgi:hypothetical protein